MTPFFFEPGRNCSILSSADEAAALVDARCYYRAVHRALRDARHHVLMTGWQFHTDVELLRGPDRPDDGTPTALLDLMLACLEARPEAVRTPLSRSASDHLPLCLGLDRERLRPPW